MSGEGERNEFLENIFEDTKYSPEIEHLSGRLFYLLLTWLFLQGTLCYNSLNLPRKVT